MKFCSGGVYPRLYLYTIPEEYGIDGVIGLNFMRQFNIELDFKRGALTLNRFS